MNKIIYLLLVFVLLLSACNFPGRSGSVNDGVGPGQMDSDLDPGGSDGPVGEYSQPDRGSEATQEDAAGVPLDFDINALPQGDLIGEEYAGLLYTSADGEGAWIVGSDGFGHQLIDRGDGFVFNPKTFQVAYLAPVYEEDIFLYDLLSGETSQLTDTPDLLETRLAFLPGSDLLAFNYMPVDQLGPWGGYLGAVDLKTAEYLIFDDRSTSYYGYAVSPRDGTILYDDEGLPFWYSLETGPVAVPMDHYAPEYSSFASPAISPDGFKLTFMAYGGPQGPNGGNGNGIVVIDTSSGTSRVLHPYESFGQRVGPEIVWSPDGRWIAAVTQGEFQATANGVGLWMIDPNGADGQEHLIGMGTTPIWSPEGMNLLYIEWGSGSYLEAKVMRVMHDFSTIQVPLPAGSFPFQWVDLSD